MQKYSISFLSVISFFLVTTCTVTINDKDCGVPAATELRITSEKSNSIIIAWSSRTCVTSYIIERSYNISPKNWQTLAEVSPSVLSYTDTNLHYLYSYRVKACNVNKGCSYSNEVNNSTTTSGTLEQTEATGPLLADHTCISINEIPNEWINKTKNKLHIAYGHTSFGSQILSGMTGLVTFKSALFNWSKNSALGALDIRDNPFEGAEDLGNPNFTAWADATREYLSKHPEINIVMWSWDSQLSSATIKDVDIYIMLMSMLEDEYPNVKFIYMTGHLNGTGTDGNLNQRNTQIRDFCKAHSRILYDFADIESHDPYSKSYLEKFADYDCADDKDGTGSMNANWAFEWQNTHTEGVDWFNCDAPHTQPLNANMKAYAAWWLFARIAGWDGK